MTAYRCYQVATAICFSATDTLMVSRMQRKWPAQTGKLGQMAAIVKAFNFEKFGDKAQIKTSLMMEISGSANGSTGWERISRKLKKKQDVL